MDEIKFHAAIMDLRASTKVIDWLAEGATPYQFDIINRLEQIAELAEQLSESARNMAENHRKETENG